MEREREKEREERDDGRGSIDGTRSYLHFLSALSLFLSLGLLIPEIYFLICLKVETGHKKQPGKNSTAAETVVPDHLPLTIQQSRARLHDAHSQS